MQIYSTKCYPFQKAVFEVVLSYNFFHSFFILWEKYYFLDANIPAAVLHINFLFKEGKVIQYTEVIY